MQANAETPFYIFGFGDFRAKNMNFMAVPDEFFDQINRFGRAATGRWKERLVRQKSDAQPGIWFLHVQTYSLWGAAFKLIL